jgi:hypothetical protein
MNVLGQSIIVIDKYESAVELLDKRSGIYSSRFVTPVFFSKASNIWSRATSPVLELLPGWGDGLIFVPYGNVTATIIMLLSWLIEPSSLGDRWYVRHPPLSAIIYLSSLQAPPATPFYTSNQ